MDEMNRAPEAQQPSLYIDEKFLKWMDKEYQKQERAIKRFRCETTKRARAIVTEAENIKKLLGLVFVIDKPSYILRIGEVYKLLDEALAKKAITPALYQSIKDVLEGRE